MINEPWLWRVDFSRRASSRAAAVAKTRRAPPGPPAFPEMTPARQAPHMEKVKYKLLLKEASLSRVS